MADRERVRWHLTQAKRNALDTIDGRARLGKDWAADPVTKAGITKLVETAAEYMGNVPLETQVKFPMCLGRRWLDCATSRRMNITGSMWRSSKAPSSISRSSSPR